MNAKTITCLFGAIIFLQACSTPYQKEGFTGGYTELQLDDNAFRITFRGNANTSRENASDFALLRSAEIALNHGYKYFVIIDAKEYTKQSTYTTPITTTGSTSLYGNTAYGSYTTRGGQTFLTAKPASSNTILCYNEKPEGFSYNAEFIVRSIRDKYKLEY